jgi:hypothetical protein
MNEHDRNDDDQVEPIDFVEPPHPDLSKISGEMAALRIPGVDAAKIEAELFAKLAHEPVPARRGGFLSLPLVAATIAAAALGLLAFRASHGADEVGVAGADAQPLAAASPAGLAAPASPAEPRLNAGAEELRIVRDGLATLVLEPGAVVRVTRDDDVLSVELEQGALRAYVVPRVEKERVVVLSNGVRVAVHGTVFRVARAGETTDVDLLRGSISVALGGAGAGRSPQLVEAPRGFSVTGGAFEPRAAHPFVEIAGAWLEPRTTKASPPEKGASRGADEGLRARVVTVANECFQRETSRLAPDVNVQVSSSIVVAVGEAGRVSSVSFASPLAPGLEACIQGALKNERGAPGTTDVKVSLARR